MKKIVALILSVIILLGICSSVHAEEEITVELPVAMGTGSRPSMKKEPTRDNSVVPYAIVSWGDTPEAVAQAASGEVKEQDNITIVTASTQIEGIFNPVPVIYSFDGSGLCQVEAILTDHLATKINDLTTSATGQAIIKQTENFFKGEDRYVWTGEGIKIFMSSNTTASLRCRGEKGSYRLSIIYYPPDPFDTGIVEAAEGIVRLEAGRDMQYYPGSIKTHNFPALNNLNAGLMYIIRVAEYQIAERRIPYFALCLYCAGAYDLGEAQSFSFLIDGKQYVFTGITVDYSGNDSNKKATYSATLGENSLDFWEALENAEDPVKFTFTFIPKGSGVSTLDAELTAAEIELLVRGYQMYRDANGLSSIALDYASDGESQLTVTDWNEITSAAPEFTLDTSAVPFTEIKWDIKMNSLAKALGVKAEKEGNTSVLHSTVSIDGFGENMPVKYTFRNNKLASVKVIITHNYGYDTGFRQSAKGMQLWNYIDSFIGQHPHYSYSSQEKPFEYNVTDVTEMNYGLLKNGSSYDLSMEFFPAQQYDVSALKKNKKVSTSPSGSNNVIYCDTEPAFFEHAYTYDGRRYTYSYFQWCIMMRDVSHNPGKVPLIYYGFTYNGIKNPSSAKWLSFAIDNDVFRFELRDSEIGKLSKTQYGELSQTFAFQIDCNNYEFLERLSKGKKVVVTLQGDGFLLNFDLPAKAKQQMVEGMKNFEKVCGIVDGPLAFNRFSGTPVTIY